MLEDQMKIAVLGHDSRAAAIGQLLVDAGYEVGFENAAECELLVLAGPQNQMDDLLAQAGQIPTTTIVIDAMEGPVARGAGGPVQLARRLHSHRVVFASIALPLTGANVLYCGDDAEAKTIVENVFRTAGCVTTDRGPLANAAEIEVPRKTTGESSFETLKFANAAASADMR